MSAWANAMWLWSWQALLMIAGAAIVIAAVRSETAAHRHTFWLVVLLVTVSLPAANAVVVWFPELPRPAITMPMPEAFQTENRADFRSAGIPAKEEAMPGTESQSIHRVQWLSAAGIVVLTVWLLGTALSLLGSVRSYLVYRAYRAAASFSGQVASSRGVVPIAYSAGLQVPVLVGYRSPVILLPEHIREWMSVEEQQAVILHEVAHYERRDQWIGLLQVFIRAVLFFHPAVRYALHQLSAARELACDERVLRGGTAPAAYAEAILKIAERCVVQKEIVSPAMNTSARFLDRRVEMIRSYNNILTSPSLFASLVRLVAIVFLAVLVLPGRVLTSQTPRAVPAAGLAQRGTVTPNSTLSNRAGAEQTRPVNRQSSTLNGVVKEPEGRLISGLEVVLTPQEPSGIRYTTVSGGRGNYEFVDVVPGRYTLSTTTPSTVIRWEPFQADITLAPGSQSLPIQFVSAVAPPIGGAARATAPLAAQIAPAVVSGRVFDQTGALVPGVILELRNADILLASTISNEAGTYRFSIQPGQYTLQARLPGFALHRRTLNVRAGEALSQNVLLQLAPTMSRVEVSAAKGPLQSVPDTSPMRIGGDVAAPNLVSSARPAYPARARALHIEGDVVLQAVITAEGTIASVHVDPEQSTTDLSLIQAAVDAVKQWRYRPAFLNGQPIEVTTMITVTFSLMD